MKLTTASPTEPATFNWQFDSVFPARPLEAGSTAPVDYACVRLQLLELASLNEKIVSVIARSWFHDRAPCCSKAGCPTAAVGSRTAFLANLWAQRFFLRGTYANLTSLNRFASRRMHP